MKGRSASGDGSPTRARPKPARTPLSRRRVLEGALALVEREGAEALTMRRLGRQLGVEAMSLYNHVENREAVLDGLGEMLAEGLATDDSNGAGWEQSARALARGVRAIAASHPEAFRLVAMRPLATVRALGPTEALLAHLRSAGFSAGDTLAGYRLVLSYARGYALAELRGFTLDVAAREERPAVDLDAESLPTIVELMGALSELDVDALFESGLDAVIDGLRARLGP